ncbi:MAG: GSCFA domain-containing protein [Muribaculaceae bacterium]|nr:GSCFA domain-containing protein [Muribaculaceae bacterium]
MKHEFRTIVKPLRFRGNISHRQGVMMLGSCFSDNIGLRLRQACFDVDINPFGILYNPASIACGIGAILKCRQYSIDDLFQEKGDNRWHSFSHHSEYSSVDSQLMLEKINQRVCEANKMLQRASTLIVTFGTAWVYKYAPTGKVVANCHKLPASMFERSMMSIDEIVAMWKDVIADVKAINQSIQVIFTVSPIRHLRDGAHENQLSKSTLLLAINQLVRECEDVKYFPAYEIMNDDLRDYRFYASDMTHPSEVAVDYIYDIFSQSFFDDDTISLAEKCVKLSKRLMHIPMSDDQDAVARFVHSTNQLKTQLLQQYPFLEAAISKIK